MNSAKRQTEKKLTAKFVNELLLDKGYLKETAEQGEEKHKRVTEKGRLAGILEEERHAKYGKSYYALIHTRESQSMILTELKEYFASQENLRIERKPIMIGYTI